MTCSWRFLLRPLGTKTFSYTLLSFLGLAVVDHLLVWHSCCLILFVLRCRGYPFFLCLFWIELVCKEPLPAPGNRSNERRYKEKDLATTERKKVGTGEKRGGRRKAGVVKSRHGWTMYLNLVTSQYILYFKKCPIEDVE
ncbi:hypothetical protein TNCV_4617071 [Trichonephila clavipes]|nr:hypothetical protein TNCV_4617071 [Trichonephila clavipes]